MLDLNSDSSQVEAADQRLSFTSPAAADVASIGGPLPSPPLATTATAPTAALTSYEVFDPGGSPFEPSTSIDTEAWLQELLDPEFIKNYSPFLSGGISLYSVS
jgi:hypothetical protein